jgi:hypothetical protein
MDLNLKKKKVMNNTKCLIITYGFFGDIMFASSLAKKLRSQYDQIDYLIGFPQMQRLLQNNPYIDNVYVSNIPGPKPVNSIPTDQYARIIELSELHYEITPCEEYQQQAGILNTSSKFEVYTESSYDTYAQAFIDQLRVEHKKPVIGVMSNWEPKTYLFTREQYKAGVDVPNLGYGGAHRNISYITSELERHVTLIPIGVGDLNQQQTISIPDNDTKSLLFEASVLKYCDAFIGTDGGLATLAAGVGCKTIITGDFNLQLYGWNGVLKKIKDPKLGPNKYFPSVGHITINPYYNDNQVVQTIIENIKQ